MWTSSCWGAIPLNPGQGRRERTRIQHMRFHKGLCWSQWGREQHLSGKTGLSCEGEPDSGFVKCFSLVLRCFYGNQRLQTLPLKTLAPLHRCYNAPPAISTPHWEGLFSAGSFDRAAAMLAPATSTEARPELIMSFHWLKGTSAGLNSFSSVAD